MIVTEFTKSALAYRRDQRRMAAAGYIFISEPIWQLRRGASWDRKIIDVKIGADRQSVWVKLDGELKT